MGSGQLIPEQLVKELNTLLLGKREYSWSEESSNPIVPIHDVEIKKQLQVVTGQPTAAGFLVAYWEARHPRGTEIAISSVKWQHYFFDDFDSAIEVFTRDEISANKFEAARNEQRERALRDGEGV